MIRTGLVAVALAAFISTAAQAQIANGVLKIGVLNDQSGVCADFGGKWSVEAAKMAVEDFAGKILGAPIEILSADHQWDLYKLLAVVAAEQAYFTFDQSGCKLTK